MVEAESSTGKQFGSGSQRERWLGLDFGTRTVGVAATDALGITVQPLETIWRKEETHLRKTLRRVGELIEELSVTGIVLGLPLNMDGSEGERAKKTRDFGEALEKRFGIPVYLADERLTTAEAEEILAEGGVRPEDFKTYIDKIAAAIILEDYLRGRLQV
ncbi:MAG: Holliday junction resolvase RuvX [bacterium]